MGKEPLDLQPFMQRNVEHEADRGAAVRIDRVLRGNLEEIASKAVAEIGRVLRSWARAGSGRPTAATKMAAAHASRQGVIFVIRRPQHCAYQTPVAESPAKRRRAGAFRLPDLSESDLSPTGWRLAPL